MFSQLLKDNFDDVVITRPARAYLEAFTAYIVASRTGDLAGRSRAKRWRRDLLAALEGPISPDLGRQ